MTKSLKAGMVWMDQQPLQLHRRYLLKHTSQTVPVFLTAVDHRADLATLNHEPARTLQMNDIGAVAAEFAASHCGRFIRTRIAARVRSSWWIRRRTVQLPPA